jgi:lipoate-protein ligase A
MSDSPYRLIHSPRQSAEENMVQDSALLAAFDKDGMPLFRLYSWEESVTIGASQTFASCVTLDPALEAYQDRYAKRMTGGGILYHGHDLSYSLILPLAMMRGLSVKESYEQITGFLLDFYRTLGLDAYWAKDDPTVTLSHDPFCQVGFEPYDIIIQGYKIGGNAQKRTKKAIFQHGSVPLRRNEHGMSLEDLGVMLGEEEARERLEIAFKKRYEIWIG